MSEIFLRQVLAQNVSYEIKITALNKDNSGVYWRQMQHILNNKFIVKCE